MHSLACALAAYAVNASWEIPLLACAGWVASRWVRRCGPRAEHQVWTAVLVLGIVVPMGPWLASPGTLPGAAGAGAASVGMSLAGGSGTLRGGAVVLPEWLLGTIAALYGCCVLVALGRLLLRLRRTAWLVTRSRELTLPAEAAAVWEQAISRFAVRGVEVRCSEQVGGVAAVEWRRTLILVAPGFVERCSRDDFRSALGHELAHLERHDPWKNLLYEAAGVLAAFHPVLGMVKARVGRSREMVCDAMAVERLVEVKAYRQSLLRLAQGMVERVPAGVPVLGLFDGNALEERMMRMKTDSVAMSRPVRAGLVAAATVLLAMTAASGALAKGVAAADHGAGLGKVYEPGPGVTNPKLVFAPNPEYSVEARRAKYQGVCVVGLIVDTQGYPQKVHVIRPLGMGLDEKALAAVREYRFAPGLHEGKPVAVAIKIEVNFRVY